MLEDVKKIGQLILRENSFFDSIIMKPNKKTKFTVFVNFSNNTVDVDIIEYNPKEVHGYTGNTQGTTTKNRSTFVADRENIYKLITKTIKDLPYNIQFNKETLEQKLFEKSLYFKDKVKFLVVLQINGKDISEDSKYRKNLENVLINQRFKKYNATCYICGYKGNVTDNTASMMMGFYNTDKQGFSSTYQNKKFTGNFVICKNCYKDILAGENFIKYSLSSYINNYNFYVIPKFLLPINNIKDITNTMDLIKQTFFEIDYRNLIKKMKEFNTPYLLDFIFFNDGEHGSKKIVKTISDIPPHRINFIKKIENKYHDDMLNLLDIDENDNWYFNPLQISKLFWSKNKKINIFLEIIYAIFSNTRISRTELLDTIIELLSEKYYKQKEGTFVYSIMNYVLFVNFLEKINILRRKKKMCETKINDHVDKFINKMGYDEQQTAMFLLGHLIGNIGNKQYRDTGKKPILKKITISSINRIEITELSNDIFIKLKQYDILQYNEMLYHQFRSLFDEQDKKWNLSEQENIFYLLAGYSYSSCRSITEGKKLSEENGIKGE